MLWRHLCLARAWSAAGLLSGTLLGATALAEPDGPVPLGQPETQTVQILDASRSGDLALNVRGQGSDRVRVSIRNTSARRLNVVIPPGLVASSATGQRGGGGGGGGGGFQSMGLGTTENRPGSFGQFRAAVPESGLQSVGIEDERKPDAVTVPAGQAVEFSITAVCLNFGAPTPTPKDRFQLVDVGQFSPDPRVGKALRSLAALGTSQGVAQAVMWRVCNDVPFDLMAEQAAKAVNPHEIALAARFIEALDASGDARLVDADSLAAGRVFVHVQGEGPLAQEADRLSEGLDGLYVLGLPVRVVRESELPTVPAPALLLNVALTGSRTGETQGRVALSRAVAADRWAPLGKTTFTDGSSIQVLDGPALAKALDRAIAAAFVTVKPARRAVGSTTLKVENHLPFTLASVVVKASGSAGAPTVSFPGLGVGPARSALAPIQAPGATVERIELNGL